MTIRGFLFFSLFSLATLVSLTPIVSAADEPLNAEQKKAIEGMIHEYLLKNPEVMLESIRRHQIRQEQAELDQKRQLVKKLGKELRHNASSPVAGNPDGNVTIVEFFDYRCGYCKTVLPTIQKLLKDDGNIRYVLKEFPILGPDSVTAAKAALAVWELSPDQYMPFHTAIMTARGQLTENRISKIAAKFGINSGKLKSKMNSKTVVNELQQNMQLAQQLGISGTPAFIIGDELAPGAIDINTMRHLVAAAR